MTSRNLFWRTLALFILIAIMYILAEFFYLHWSIWWYDVILHFLSGFCASMFFVYFYFKFYQFSFDSRPGVILFSASFVFVVGVLWEFFELSYNLTSLSHGKPFVFDTTSDILADLSGGFFGTIYGFRFFSNKT
jgi:Kef-type K+ transport system membrane component KefB